MGRGPFVFVLAKHVSFGPFGTCCGSCRANVSFWVANHPSQSGLPVSHKHTVKHTALVKQSFVRVPQPPSLVLGTGMCVCTAVCALCHAGHRYRIQGTGYSTGSRYVSLPERLRRHHADADSIGRPLQNATPTTLLLPIPDTLVSNYILCTIGTIW